MYKVAVFNLQTYEKPFFEEFTEQLSFLYTEEPLNMSNVMLAKNCHAVVIHAYDNVDRKLLECLKNDLEVSLLATRSIGFNHIDCAAAKELGITVCRAGHASSNSVAEFGVALLLSLVKNLQSIRERAQLNDFTIPTLTSPSSFIGLELVGKVCGIIGLGSIGFKFAKILAAFDATVICYDPFVQNAEAIALGVTYVSTLDELLSRSDIISLHCCLTDSNFHMIDRVAVSKMKRGVSIINVSRGGLIDNEALLEGLDSGVIRHFGGDVLDGEAAIFRKDHSVNGIKDINAGIDRLVQHPHTIISPHIAFYTEDAVRSITKMTVDNITNILGGKGSGNIVC